MDHAQKKAGPPQSLSKRWERINKRRTHKVRRQEGQTHLDRAIGDRLKATIEHPEDLACMSHMKQGANWYD